MRTDRIDITIGGACDPSDVDEELQAVACHRANVHARCAPDAITRRCGSGGARSNGAREGLDVAIEAGDEATPVLETAGHARDDVALRVGGAIMCVPDWPLRRGAISLGTALVEPRAQRQAA